MARHFWAIFLLLAIGVTFVSHESLFGTTTYDEGDDAANALQIERAKHFHELHGNYSRWDFHHPGPAFFYIYAWGEWLLEDVVGIAPAPRNAHVYAGTLLQLAFFAAAIALLAQHSRRPEIAIGLALALAAWHFGHVDGALYSVWPPYVLLMPFLCFLVACAAVAIGNKTAMVPVILAGGFLVHGHIAQPLFVGPMGLMAIWLGARRHKAYLRTFAKSGVGLLSICLLAAFLLPIGLDLLAGSASNAHHVWLHIKYFSDHGQTLKQSLLCYGSYFIGMNNPTMFNQLSAESYAPFVAHFPRLLCWSLLAVTAAYYLLWSKRADRTDDLTFGRQLLWFWLFGSVLTLVWGMRQDGGFTNFNSHFNHALVYGLGLVAVVMIAHWLPQTSRAFGRCIMGAGAITFVLALPFDFDVGSRANEVMARVAGLRQADPRPMAPKLLEFTSASGPNNWYEAVTLGRELQRLGVPFYVSSDMRTMFGDDKIFANQADVLDHGGVSVWRIISRKNAPPAAHILNRECSVLFPPPVVFAQLPIQITFSPEKETPAALFGVGAAEGEWAWTRGHVVAFEFEAPVARTNLDLAIDASGMVTNECPNGQRATVLVNGSIVERSVFTENRRTIHIQVSRAVWNARTTKTILMELPDAIPPAYVARSGDLRILALRLYGITIRPAAVQ